MSKNAGFVEEFVMDQYNYIMIVPSDITIDVEGYENWKKSNPVTIDLHKVYVISYEKEK